MSSALIHVDSPEIELPRELLHAEGGFAWWYVDWWDEHGNGLVLIWSFGLPFLPGYAGSAREGNAVAAGQRPSLNVSVYRGGKPVFYQLQEYDAADAEWLDGGVVRLGDSRLRSWLDGDRRRVEISLDCPVPGTDDRLQGLFRSEGPAIRHRTSRTRAAGHIWTPLLVGARAHADLAVGGDKLLSGEGRIYHDRNGCPVPMQQLGIERWLWGRAAMPDSDLIWYVLQGKHGGSVAMAFTVDGDGQLTELPDVSLDEAAGRRALFGLAYPGELVLRSAGEVVAHIEHQAVVDDGPFYLRMHTRVTDAAGREGRGSGEYIVPDNIDLPWQRPLVRMAVHHTSQPNSMWLPLFGGRTRDRWQRLLRSSVVRLWPSTRRPALQPVGLAQLEARDG